MPAIDASQIESFLRLGWQRSAAALPHRAPEGIRDLLMHPKHWLVFRDRWGKIFFVICCIVFMADAVLPELLSEKTKDYRLWFKTGQAILNGRELYQPGNFDFLYLPFSAILLAPLTIFGKPVMYTVLALINMAAWALTIEFTGRLCSFAPVSRVTVWLPSLLLIPLIATIFDLGQYNILLLALILLGFLAMARDRSGFGGALIAFAAALKAFPITILPYLIVRREFKAAIAMTVAFAIFTVAVPALVLGPEKTVSDLKLWTSSMLIVDQNRGLGQRPGSSWNYKNQSLIGVVHRLTRPVESARADKPENQLYVNVTDLGFDGSNVAFAVIAAGIGLAFAVLLLKTDYTRPEVRACELGILLNLVAMASPLARDYYHVWWLFPVAVLVGFAMSSLKEVRRGAMISVAGAIACLLLNYSSFKIFPALGCMLWGAGILNIALARRALVLSASKQSL